MSINGEGPSFGATLLNFWVPAQVLAATCSGKPLRRFAQFFGKRNGSPQVYPRGSMKEMFNILPVITVITSCLGVIP